MIKTLDLGKKFGERVAIHKLNLSIEKGEVFGLLGPNGAGKTTFIRMVTMLARPTSGKILINGLDTAEHEQEIKQFIGIVPQHFNLDPDLFGVFSLPGKSPCPGSRAAGHQVPPGYWGAADLGDGG